MQQHISVPDRSVDLQEDLFEAQSVLQRQRTISITAFGAGKLSDVCALILPFLPLLSLIKACDRVYLLLTGHITLTPYTRFDMGSKDMLFDGSHC